MRRGRLILLGPLFLLVFACHRSAKIVGAWTMQSQQSVGSVVVSSASEDTFLDNGKYVSVSRNDGHNGVVIVATNRGKWTLEGDTLTVTLDDVDWQFEGGTPEGRERARKRFLERRAEIVKLGNKENSHKITFVGNDMFSFTVKDKKYVEKRKGS